MGELIIDLKNTHIINLIGKSHFIRYFFAYMYSMINIRTQPNFAQINTSEVPIT